MVGYHSLIGYPWIIDCIAKYDSAAVKQKPVIGQVVEFLRMPARSVYSEDCQYPEAVVNISDQKYYIRAVITKEAQETLESEDEHFSLADIKNKIIILKKFCMCFTAAEDPRRCEFYLSVQHFSVLPMETNTVDLLNCNMEPGVMKKMKELRQDYMAELEMNESLPDVNLSDVSLTQLLMIASEEKFSALKSVAEQCLELIPPAIQDVPQQDNNIWTIERKGNQENAKLFVIPLDLLLIPPHEEAVLEQMTECRYEGPCTPELADSSEGDNSSQPYSTALSTLDEDPIEEGPSGQSQNPWNKLQSLCVSVATSSDSQPQYSSSGSQKSKENEVGSDPDSSTPDILTPPAEMGDTPDGKSGISPLMFSEHSSNPEQPSTSRPQTDSVHSNSSPSCEQGGSVHSSVASINLIPLTQDSFNDSLQRSLSAGGKFLISPVKFHMSGNKSSPANKRDCSSLNNESNRGKSCSPATRRASKRKHTSEDPESTLSDLAQQEPAYMEEPDCVTTTVPSGDEIDKVSDNEDGVNFIEVRNQIGKEAAIPDANMEQNMKTEQYVKSHSTEHHISIRKRLKAHKPTLQFVANPTILVTKDSVNGPTTNQDSIQEAPSNATHRPSSSFHVKDPVPIMDIGRTKLVHQDGTPFQYKYKLPSEDLCTHVKAIQIPAGLCEWALKMLSEDQEKVL